MPDFLPQIPYLSSLCLSAARPMHHQLTSYCTTVFWQAAPAFCMHWWSVRITHFYIQRQCANKGRRFAFERYTHYMQQSWIMTLQVMNGILELAVLKCLRRIRGPQLATSFHVSRPSDFGLPLNMNRSKSSRRVVGWQPQFIRHTLWPLNVVWSYDSGLQGMVFLCSRVVWSLTLTINGAAVERLNPLKQGNT